ncbi:MAG: pgl 2 [Bacteroidetes bacterium]|nr:pgl 2 [Bacteroidota bacterium]
MNIALNRRRFLTLAGGALGAALIPSRRNLLTLSSRAIKLMRFYVGTYTGGGSKGIYHCAFDPSNGRIEILGATGGIENPSFLAAGPGGRNLFAVSETAEFEGEPGGSVHAFAVDSDTGGLTHLNSRPSNGADPAHLSIDNHGRFVLVANYTGGNVCVFPVRDDGRLDPLASSVRHVGKGPNPKRQNRPHAHSIILDPANRRAFSADLGIDRVMVYAFNRDSGALAPAEQPSVPMKPGAGPRHLDFSPDARHIHVVNELNSTVTVLSYDAESGSLSEADTVSTLPPSFTADNTCADIHVHPTGRFVYASNRGHDSIAVFVRNSSTGSLKAVQHQSTLGKTPRNFTIDPTGRFLLVANQQSDSLVVMNIDTATGVLSPAGVTASVPDPVCVRFMPAS